MKNMFNAQFFTMVAAYAAIGAAIILTIGWGLRWMVSPIKKGGKQ